jgi:hypothetical protein
MAKKSMDVLRTSKLLKIYDDMAKKTLELLTEYNDDQLVASTLVAQGIRIYKAVLSEEEFKDMLKIIVNDATNIKPFVEEKKEDTIN